MASFLSNLTSYGAGNTWEVTDETLLKDLDEEGFQDIESAEVIEKEQSWGISTSICLFMSGNVTKYIPLSRDSVLEAGDKVDPKSINILTLEREGDDPIYKADGEVLDEKPKRKGKK